MTDTTPLTEAEMVSKIAAFGFDRPEPIVLEVNGRTISAVPCSKRHRSYFEAGYLVASCRKCKLTNITTKGPADV